MNLLNRRRPSSPARSFRTSPVGAENAQKRSYFACGHSRLNLRRVPRQQLRLRSSVAARPGSSLQLARAVTSAGDLRPYHPHTESNRSNHALPAD